MSVRSEVIRIFNELIGQAKKISDLPALPTNVDNTDLFEVSRGGTSYKGLGSQLPSGGGGGTVDSVVAGTGISVDSTDPANPVVTNSGVQTLTGAGVDNTDPQNPTMSFPDASEVVFTPSGGISATTVNDALIELDNEKVDKAGAKVIQVAASDETTALTTGTKVTFRMPYAMTVTAVRASLTTAQASGNVFTVDIHESGTTILSTKITIDNGEETSTTAATPPVISDAALADDAEITIDIDQIGNGTAAGLKVSIIGT